jgi:uncharacterized protein YigA (DUF484 family)
LSDVINIEPADLFADLAPALATRAGHAPGDAGEAPPAEWALARSMILTNPDLVRADAPLLQALGLRPHAPNVVDFGAVAVARLEAARDRESEARREMEGVAQANFAAQAQTHAAVLDLLAATNSADLAYRLHEVAQRRFGLEIASVGVEGHPPPGWRALPVGLVGYVLAPDQTCAVGPCTGGGELFGEAVDRVKSVALVRLSLFDPKRAGLVAFGSADPDGFAPDMGVELIAFLGQVVERLAERWPPRS